MDVYERSLALHRETKGKLEVISRMRLDSTEDLSLAYTPGVARPCEVIAKDSEASFDLTWRGRCVAVVSDGSAVLGLGDIGPAAAMPVMEGKAVLFKEFAGVDAVPIVIDERSEERFIGIVRSLVSSFGAINLEDIAAPRCFRIEDALQDVGIPVLHDDQHGTAIVLLAAILNAGKALGRPLSQMSVVINGAGAAGRAIARMLSCADADDRCIPVGKVRVCDSRGVIFPGRKGDDEVKQELARASNPEGDQGDLRDALRGADVFIGVSKGNLLSAADVRTMAKDPVVIAMANPTPEILPDEAREGGAAVVGTGRSDFPNQVNNVLAFPGLFRGALDARATRFTNAMQFAAVEALAACVEKPVPERILPPPFDRSVAQRVAAAVADQARSCGVSRVG